MMACLSVGGVFSNQLDRYPITTMIFSNFGVLFNSNLIPPWFDSGWCLGGVLWVRNARSSFSSRQQGRALLGCPLTYHLRQLRAARRLARGLHPNWESTPSSTTISDIFVLAAGCCINALIILLGHGDSRLKSYQYVDNVFFLNDAAQGAVDIGVGYHVDQAFRLLVFNPAWDQFSWSFILNLKRNASRL